MFIGGFILGLCGTVALLHAVYDLFPRNTKNDFWFGVVLIVIIVSYLYLAGELQDWAELYYHHIIESLLEKEAEDVTTAVQLPGIHVEYLTHLVGAGHIGCEENFHFFVTKHGKTQYDLIMAGSKPVKIKYPGTDY